MKSGTSPLPSLKSVDVFEPLRERIRDLHVSIRIGAAYVHWVRAFIRLHGLRRVASLGGAAVEAFGSRLAEAPCGAVRRWQLFGDPAVTLMLPAVEPVGCPRAARPHPMPPEPSIHAARSLMHLEIAIPCGAQGGADARSPRRGARW